MINNVTLVGRLTHDPELRYTPSGVAVTRFNIAVNRNYTNRNGEREADFIDIVTWRGLAENCANYLRKGSLVGVVGRIETKTYENQEGRKVKTFHINAENVQFLEPKGRREFMQEEVDKAKELFGDNVEISDEDLPF